MSPGQPLSSKPASQPTQQVKSISPPILVLVLNSSHRHRSHSPLRQAAHLTFPTPSLRRNTVAFPEPLSRPASTKQHPSNSSINLDRQRPSSFNLTSTPSEVRRRPRLTVVPTLIYLIAHSTSPSSPLCLLTALAMSLDNYTKLEKVGEGEFGVGANALRSNQGICDSSLLLPLPTFPGVTIPPIYQSGLPSHSHSNTLSRFEAKHARFELC
jgi:hypothetical protein